MDLLRRTFLCKSDSFARFFGTRHHHSLLLSFFGCRDFSPPVPNSPFRILFTGFFLDNNLVPRSSCPLLLLTSAWWGWWTIIWFLAHAPACASADAGGWKGWSGRRGRWGGGGSWRGARAGGKAGSRKAAATSEPSRIATSQVPTPGDASFSLVCSGTRFSPEKSAIKQLVVYLRNTDKYNHKDKHSSQYKYRDKYK